MACLLPNNVVFGIKMCNIQIKTGAGSPNKTINLNKRGAESWGIGKLGVSCAFNQPLSPLLFRLARRIKKDKKDKGIAYWNHYTNLDNFDKK